MQNYVVAFGVDVFSVDEKSVHVKETGADPRESGSSVLAHRGVGG